MSIAYLFDRVGELKQKFKNFFQQKKKIKAIENHTQVVPFSNKVDQHCFNIVKTCFESSFLDEEQERFLNHILGKLEINYLDWAHKTKWLKNEIYKKKTYIRPTPEQLYFFNLDSLTSQGMDVPLELLTQNQNGVSARR